MALPAGSTMRISGISDSSHPGGDTGVAKTGLIFKSPSEVVTIETRLFDCSAVYQWVFPAESGTAVKGRSANDYVGYHRHHSMMKIVSSSTMTE